MSKTEWLWITVIGGIGGVLLSYWIGERVAALFFELLFHLT